LLIIEKGYLDMAITPKSRLHKVRGIRDLEIATIKAYMQGAVYCWVKNRKDEPFSVRDLVGGENYEWKGTPLYALWTKQVNSGKKGNLAIKNAGKDLGFLTKTVLSDDKRTFIVEKAGMVNSYRWVGGEP
jgi:hypothetical protein